MISIFSARRFSYSCELLYCGNCTDGIKIFVRFAYNVRIECTAVVPAIGMCAKMHRTGYPEEKTWIFAYFANIKCKKTEWIVDKRTSI